MNREEDIKIHTNREAEGQIQTTTVPVEVSPHPQTQTSFFGSLFSSFLPRVESKEEEGEKQNEVAPSEKSKDSGNIPPHEEGNRVSQSGTRRRSVLIHRGTQPTLTTSQIPTTSGGFTSTPS